MAVLTGTGAATLHSIVGGITITEIQFRYKSRPVWYDEEKKKVFEVLSTSVFCQFDDDSDFDATIYTDKERYYATIAYDDDETVVNNQAAAGRPSFRHYIEALPAPGCFGTFAQLGISKSIHYLNGFDFFGFNMYPIYRPGIGPEFIAGGSTLQNGW